MSDLEASYHLLRDHLNVWELVEDLGIRGSYLGAKGNLFACCPFHDDRDPSWGIQTDPTHEKWGLWGCLGCHRKGNVATLVKNLQRGIHTYRQAVMYLLKRCGLAVQNPDEVAEIALASKLKFRQPRPEPASVAGWLNRFPIIEWGSKGWDYLQGRGIRHGQMVRSKVREGTGYYSGRVVFPILNSLHRPVSFYARAIGEAEKKGLYPKGYRIGGTLWGMDNVDLFNPKAYIVEGIFDGLAVERALDVLRWPVSNVFAVLKSSISEEQAVFLNQFSEIIVLPDMKGGGPGLMPSAKKFLGERRLQVVEVEPGEDPDSQERGNGLTEFLKHSKSAYQTDVKFFVRYDVPRGS